MQDKFNIQAYLKERRGGRAKLLGGVYKLTSSENVCRIFDYEKIDGDFIYEVELLNDRFHSTEFLGVVKIKEIEIGVRYTV